MKKLNGVVAFLAAFALMFGIVSCNPNADEMEKTVKVTGITLNKTELTLTAGGKETLTATVKPDNATDKTVTWTSDKTDIATVSANGEVTAIAKGNATITATAGEKSATCSLTVKPVTYVVNITGGTALPANAEAGSTVVISATVPENGKVFDKWITNDVVTFEDVSEEETTFTMPEKVVTITATYKDSIGSKSKPTAVGDIVFKDGSASSYTEALSNEQKAAAIAVIFYAGSESDVLGAKTLGVGLQNTQDAQNTRWANSSTEGFRTKIESIICTPSVLGSEAAETATFDDDTDGSDNWLALKNALGENDDTDISGNYPAWEWVASYAVNNNIAGKYSKGWYLPTIAELSLMYREKATVQAALEEAGGMKINENAYYRTSSQGLLGNRAYLIRLGNGYIDWNYLKDEKRAVCCIRKF